MKNKNLFENITEAKKMMQSVSDVKNVKTGLYVSFHTEIDQNADENKIYDMEKEIMDRFKNILFEFHI